MLAALPGTQFSALPSSTAPMRTAVRALRDAGPVPLHLFESLVPHAVVQLWLVPFAVWGPGCAVCMPPLRALALLGGALRWRWTGRAIGNVTNPAALSYISVTEALNINRRRNRLPTAS